MVFFLLPFGLIVRVRMSACMLVVRLPLVMTRVHFAMIACFVHIMLSRWPLLTIPRIRLLKFSSLSVSWSSSNPISINIIEASPDAHMEAAYHWITHEYSLFEVLEPNESDIGRKVMRLIPNDCIRRYGGVEVHDCLARYVLVHVEQVQVEGRFWSFRNAIS